MTTTTSHRMTTAPSELGQLAAEAIGEMVRRAGSGVPLVDLAEGYSPLAWSTLQSGGWDTVAAPGEGGDATLVDLVVIARAWGRACLPLPLLVSLLAKRWSTAAAAHDGPVTVALPQRASSSGYVPFGQYPGIQLALALDADDAADDLVDVPAGVPDTTALTWRATEVPVVSRLSVRAVQEFAVVLAAEATGGAERLLADAIAFAGERQQFGRPIGSFQAVKHHLADAAMAAELAETAVIWAAQRVEERFRGSEFAIQQCLEVAEIALQVHGGLGFTWEMGVHVPLRQMMVAKDLVSALALIR